MEFGTIRDAVEAGVREGLEGLRDDLEGQAEDLRRIAAALEVLAITQAVQVLPRLAGASPDARTLKAFLEKVSGTEVTK